MSVVQGAALLSGAGKTGGAGSRGMAVELNGMISSAVWRACFYARANCGFAGCAALLRTVSNRSKALPAADEAIPVTQDRAGYRSRLQRASRKAPAYAVRSKRNTRRNYPGLFRCEAPKLRGSGCALILRSAAFASGCRDFAANPLPSAQRANGSLPSASASSAPSTSLQRTAGRCGAGSSCGRFLIRPAVASRRDWRSLSACE